MWRSHAIQHNDDNDSATAPNGISPDNSYLFYGVMKSTLILLLGHEILDKNLGWAISCFGKFLEFHPPHLTDTL